MYRTQFNKKENRYSHPGKNIIKQYKYSGRFLKTRFLFLVSKDK